MREKTKLKSAGLPLPQGLQLRNKETRRVPKTKVTFQKDSLLFRQAAHGAVLDAGRERRRMPPREEAAWKTEGRSDLSGWQLQETTAQAHISSTKKNEAKLLRNIIEFLKKFFKFSSLLYRHPGNTGGVSMHTHAILS